MAKSFWEKYLKPSFEKKLEEKAQQAKEEAKKVKSNKQDDAKKEKVDDQNEKSHLIFSISARNAYDAVKAVEKPVEKPAEIKLAEPKKQETPVEKPVEKQETPIPTENAEKPAEQKVAETAEQQETPKPIVPTMIVKEGQRKLSKSERKALKKKQKMEKAEKKAASPESSATTATEKIEEAVAEGIENGEIDVVHKNPYIELIQSKVKSWDSQGNALDENGAIILDSNGNIVKVDPVAGVILMAMPQTATA